MQITLLKTADNPLKAQKQFTQVASLNCDIYDITSLTSPVFTVDFDVVNRTATHVYIPNMVGTQGWYFFIANIEEKSAQTQILTLSLDVRTTFYGQYKECTGNIIRNDSGHPTDVVDEKLPLKPNQRMSLIHLDQYKESFIEYGSNPYVIFMTI